MGDDQEEFCGLCEDCDCDSDGMLSDDTELCFECLAKRYELLRDDPQPEDDE